MALQFLRDYCNKVDMDVMELLNALTTPISPETPCGVDLREQPDADDLRSQIRDHHRNAVRSEKKLLENTGNSRSDEIQREWIQVRDLTLSTFQEKSKDLELAAYLLEALVRTDGYAGLCEGIKAVTQLVDEHWPDLHPASKEATEALNLNSDGDHEVAEEVLNIVEKRIIKLKIINESMKYSVMDVPLDEGGQFSYRDYLTSIDAERISDATSAETVTGNEITPKSIETVIERSQLTHLKELSEASGNCSEEFSKLQETIQKYGNFDISFSDLQSNLNKISQYLTELVAANSLIVEQDGSHSMANDQNGNDNNGNAHTNADQRDVHLQCIERAAKFFERIEPHSPLGPSLRRNLRWAKMSVSELWKELGITNDSFRLSGVLDPNMPDQNG